MITLSTNKKCRLAVSVLASLVSASCNALSDKHETIDEIIVTAQKHKNRMHDVPIAMSAITSKQLQSLGIDSMDGFIANAYGHLNVLPSGNSWGSTTVSIRGDGAFDIGQPTREPGVGIYRDGIYLGRAQGLNSQFADIDRIEILRGPQGTFFGRNSTSGAISLISKKPTGEFSVNQVLGQGSYGAFYSITHINMKEVAGFRAKLDFAHSERDGWVENTLQGQSDFNEYNKTGGKLTVSYRPAENIYIEYAFDQSEMKQSQVYFQLYEDLSGLIGRERNRQTKTRYPLVLKPNIDDVSGHSLHVQWQVKNLSLKSLTGYREVKEDGFNNYGDILFANGLILNEDMGQNQFTQEFQILGALPSLEWVTGVYFFNENTQFNQQFLVSLDANKNPINPPVSGAFSNFSSGAKSLAYYGHIDWALHEKVNLLAGARKTNDDKSAIRAAVPSQNIDSGHVDGSIALTYRWDEDISTYVKWANAYKAGGYNVRSGSFLPFDEEVNETWELGLKSKLFDNRLGLDIAVFDSTIKDKQFDFVNPTDTLITETLNAEKNAEISGIELDVTAAPLSGLRVGLHYSYLDGNLPIQPHPDIEGATQRFTLAQLAKHSGAITLDYTLPRFELFKLSAHIDVTSTSRYPYSSFPDAREDSYTLTNMRITLSEFKFDNEHALNLSIWGKNIFDEEYVILGFPIGTPPARTNQAFGTPRTAAIEISFEL